MTHCLAVLVVVMSGVAAIAGEPAPVPGVEPNITYGKAGDVELKLDLAIPKEGDGPFPLLVFVHGGAWRGGSKSRWHQSIVDYARKGYVAATVQYRFAPTHKFPAQIEDVKCAVRFLRSKAKEYKIDPDRVAAIGDSAGGHLALLLGLMNKDDGHEGAACGCADFSSKVQAVVNIYGPTDFTVRDAWNENAIKLVADFVGTADQAADVMKHASPITYIDKNDPPVITFHGAKDTLVPENQARRLHEQLKKIGVGEHLEVFENGGHGFAPEDWAKLVKLTDEFLEKNLKKK